MFDPAPQYSLTEDELRSLTHALLLAQPPRRTDRRFVCYRIDSGSPFANIGRSIEREVFESKFGNAADVMAAEYGPYDPPQYSTFFLSIDHNAGNSAGVARMIHNSPAGMKTLNDLTGRCSPIPGEIETEHFQAHHGVVDLDSCWDHATLAVREQYRHAGSYAGLSVQLHRASYISAIEFGIDHVVSILDERALTQIRDYLGVPFVPLCGTRGFRYLGSARSQAVYGYYPQFYQRMTGWQQYKPKRLLARHAFRQLVHGTEDDALAFTHIPEAGK